MSGAQQERAVGVGHQIPRNSLALLMLAQAFVMVPHVANVSPWIIGVAVISGAWRWMVYQGRWGHPGRWVKAGLVVAGAVGVVSSASNVFSLETATALLIVAFAFKLVEMRNRRDAYLVIFLSYFVIATAFLFDQSIALAAYELFAAVMVTAAMVGLNQLHTRVRPIASFRLAATLIGQAVPLMLVLFLFFPRVAPLWSVPLPSATTGLAESITPGDVARLSRSDEIAFRAVFEGDVPPPRGLYWRGLVYSELADGTWSAGPPLRAVARGDTLPAFFPDLVDSSSRRYQVLLEPTGQRWLFALEWPVPVSANIEIGRDFRIAAAEPVRSLTRYEVTSYPDLAIDVELPPALAARETRLPGGNPRIEAFARMLYRRAGGPEAFVAAVLAHIRSEPFVYTLQPPTLPGRGSVDAFWFDTRRGFCSHYAGAFVYVMRSVGIPARMVGGYQGGEVNPIDGHVVVRQYDAHAWAEIWLEGRGWVRVDPTAAVAPARIESGLEAAIPAEERAALSAFASLRLSGTPGITSLLYLLGSLEHRWNMWVVGYDVTLQQRYLEDLLGEVTPGRIGLALLAGGVLSLALVSLSLFWRRRPRTGHPVVRLFLRFAATLERSRLAPREGETPGAFVSRVLPSSIGRGEGQAIVDRLNALLYNPDTMNRAAELSRLRRDLRWLRLKILLAQPAEPEPHPGGSR